MLVSNRRRNPSRTFAGTFAVTSYVLAIADVHKAGMKVARVDRATPDPSVNENMAPFFTAVNSTLQLSSVVDLDPTLRPFVAKILNFQYARQELNL